MLRILKSDFTVKSVINNSTFLYNDKFADVGNFEFTLPSDQIYPDIKNGVFIIEIFIFRLYQNFKKKINKLKSVIIYIFFFK